MNSWEQPHSSRDYVRGAGAWDHSLGEDAREEEGESTGQESTQRFKGRSSQIEQGTEPEPEALPQPRDESTGRESEPRTLAWETAVVVEGQNGMKQEKNPKKILETMSETITDIRSDIQSMWSTWNICMQKNPGTKNKKPPVAILAQPMPELVKGKVLGQADGECHRHVERSGHEFPTSSGRERASLMDGVRSKTPYWRENRNRTRSSPGHRIASQETTGEFNFQSRRARGDAGWFRQVRGQEVQGSVTALPGLDNGSRQRDADGTLSQGIPTSEPGTVTERPLDQKNATIDCEWKRQGRVSGLQ